MITRYTFILKWLTHYRKKPNILPLANHEVDPRPVLGCVYNIRPDRQTRQILLIIILAERTTL